MVQGWNDAFLRLLEAAPGPSRGGPSPRGPPVKDMVRVEGGRFQMGSDGFYPEERPVHEVAVDGFWIDHHPVTNAEFRRFVKATGYVTVAEQPPTRPTTPTPTRPAGPRVGGLPAEPGPVDLSRRRSWWAWVPGASWRSPEGPGSTLHGRDRHPVVQVCHPDAAAYAEWAGKALATEAEWEYAARGGLEGRCSPGGTSATDGPARWPTPGRASSPGRTCWSTAPSGPPRSAFPANGYGLVDVTGNVWEWTSDCSPPTTAPAAARPPSAPRRRPVRRRRGDQGRQPPVRPQLLPALPAGRPQGEAVDTATTHIGFRCVLR